MPTNDLQPVRFDALEEPTDAKTANWIWNGYLHPGDVTLLTSQWKTGKTTLITGLLRSLGTGTPFLGRPTRPARVWVVSEESRCQWAERNRLMPVGAHVHLLARPFRGRPTREDWDELIDRAIDFGLDLFVVDPLASFLPGRCESDAATLLEALQPLHRLTAVGMAVLLLHHPRKGKVEAGSAARGSGAMLGFVDISMELKRTSKLESDSHCRLIQAQSRRADVPARLAYEWNPTTGEFALTTDPKRRQFEENWKTVLDLLRGRSGAITLVEILEYWPEDAEKPSRTTLYTWLGIAYDEKRIRRQGRGNKHDPWRYRLENEDDEYYDRGEPPPLKPLEW